jgi:hypothetical protein
MPPELHALLDCIVHECEFIESAGGLSAAA